MPYRNGIQSTFDGQLEILAAVQKNKHFYACGLIWGNAGLGVVFACLISSCANEYTVIR